MSELTTDHYRMLLGLDESWSVDSVDFEPDQKRVVIQISFYGPICVARIVQLKARRLILLLSVSGVTWIRCSSRLRSMTESPAANAPIAV